MIWHVKINNENTQIINIGYSYEENSSIDGVIEFDKKKRNFEIKSLSEGCSEFNSKRLFPHLWGLMKRKKLTEQTYRVVAG